MIPKEDPENSVGTTTRTSNEDKSFIIKGSFHQGDSFFTSKTRGKQCTAMTAVSVVMSILKPHKIVEYKRYRWNFVEW